MNGNAVILAFLGLSGGQLAGVLIAIAVSAATSYGLWYANRQNMNRPWGVRALVYDYKNWSRTGKDLFDAFGWPMSLRPEFRELVRDIFGSENGGEVVRYDNSPYRPDMTTINDHPRDEVRTELLRALVSMGLLPSALDDENRSEIGFIRPKRR